MTEPVPAWVYMDLPPVPDTEPRVQCPDCPVAMLGEGRLRHLGPNYHEWDPGTRRDRSRLLALAIVGALLLIAAALWGNR